MLKNLKSIIIISVVLIFFLVTAFILFRKPQRFEHIIPALNKPHDPQQNCLLGLSSGVGDEEIEIKFSREDFNKKFKAGEDRIYKVDIEGDDFRNITVKSIESELAEGKNIKERILNTLAKNRIEISNFVLNDNPDPTSPIGTIIGDSKNLLGTEIDNYYENPDGTKSYGFDLNYYFNDKIVLNACDAPLLDLPTNNIQIIRKDNQFLMEYTSSKLLSLTNEYLIVPLLSYDQVISKLENKNFNPFWTSEIQSPGEVYSYSPNLSAELEIEIIEIAYHSYKDLLQPVYLINGSYTSRLGSREKFSALMPAVDYDKVPENLLE